MWCGWEGVVWVVQLITLSTPTPVEVELGWGCGWAVTKNSMRTRSGVWELSENYYRRTWRQPCLSRGFIDSSENGGQKTLDTTLHRLTHKGAYRVWFPEEQVLLYFQALSLQPHLSLPSFTSLTQPWPHSVPPSIISTLLTKFIFLYFMNTEYSQRLNKISQIN